MIKSRIYNVRSGEVVRRIPLKMDHLFTSEKQLWNEYSLCQMRGDKFINGGSDYEEDQ